MSYRLGSSNSAVSVSTRTTVTLKQSLVFEEDEKCTSQVRERSRKSKTSRDVKRSRSHERYPLKPDTLDAAVMELEECVNKVKWLRKILDRGISSSERHQWEIVVPK